MLNKFKKNNKINKTELFNKQGYLVVKNFLPKNKCNEIIRKLENIKNKRKKNKKYIGDKNVEVIFDFFYEDVSLLKLIANKTVDNFMTKLFDHNYVLHVNSARNVLGCKSVIKNAPGYRWHKDNKFINKKISVMPSILHSIIICLDEFNEYNGATEYIPRSNKTYSFFSRNQNKKKSKKILGNKGDLIFLHGNLIHKTGINLNQNSTRWSIFAFFTPWWIKPYIDYKKLMNRFTNKLNKLEKKILHFNTTPTKNYKNLR
tara:strand:- start:15651 stop:16427 length:777 start_codon:yes stop_codon:yes gene_type:complete